MIRKVAARPVLTGLVAYITAAFVMGAVDGYRYRRDVSRRLAAFRRELDASEYANVIRDRARVKEPENA